MKWFAKTTRTFPTDCRKDEQVRVSHTQNELQK